jgi:hypothetical protein
MRVKMKRNLLKLTCFLLIFFCEGVVSNAQTQDKTITELSLRRDSFVNKIKSLGFSPTLSSPNIIIDTPASYRTFGNYNDSSNTLHTTGAWSTLPPDLQDFFNRPAARMGNGETGETFFEKSIHKWIFIHEMGHWWRKCQRQKATAYDEELAANRIAVAYWRLQDPAFMSFMLNVFQGFISHSPSPVPTGQPMEEYLNNHFAELSAGPVYTWYQAQMIVQAFNEKPTLTFTNAIKNSGNLQK